MKGFLTQLGLAAVINGHTLMTTLFINGKNQGDGTCVRMPLQDVNATWPVYPVTGDGMACGHDGQEAAQFVCSAPGKSTLSFEFRASPSGQYSGAIDPGHLGPCAVYAKKVEDMFSDSASGPGWFKIWEDGYDNKTSKWCVDRLRQNNGILSVNLPGGLPAGYYLFRTEVLALHSAYRGDPQFYVGCAQIFITDGPKTPLQIPEKFKASIPGYVDKGTPGLTFNIYKKPLPAYPLPGPDVYVPPWESNIVHLKQEKGLVPKNCLLVNANWCATTIPPYSDEQGCWKGVDNCWNQSKECWEKHPPTGGENCKVWQDYCRKMERSCKGKEFDGPPTFDGKEVYAAVPGNIPEPYSVVLGKTTQGSEPQTHAGFSPTHVIAASPSKTEAFETPTPKASDSSGGLKVSTDGRCGKTSGQTCRGSSFGECCSSAGQCGRKTRHCGCGCQAEYGGCCK